MNIHLEGTTSDIDTSRAHLRTIRKRNNLILSKTTFDLVQPTMTHKTAERFRYSTFFLAAPSG